MQLGDYLDSTYLKTPKQSGLSDSQTLEEVHKLTREATEHGFFAVMVRPDYVRSLRMLIDELNSEVKLGTVIDFPEGNGGLDAKVSEAQRAIGDVADELDFVVDYRAFKNLFLKGTGPLDHHIRNQLEKCCTKQVSNHVLVDFQGQVTVDISHPYGC